MRRFIRVTQALVEDLEMRDPGGAGLAHARALRDFYLDLARKRDWLVDSRTGEFSPRLNPTKRKPMKWPRKGTAIPAILEILAEAKSPLSIPEVHQKLAEREIVRTPQSVGRVLRVCARRRKVHRIDHRNQPLWELRKD